MSSELAISVRDVSKCYRLYAKPQDRLKQMLLRGRGHFFTEFWALKNVSFDVKRGETIGILGRNGAGKSSLLQIIAGIMTPTTGSCDVTGRVSALLELGTGFNAEFTGRENVFLSAAIIGLSNAEIEKRFDEIAAFADIGQFIDQPVKTYSSGMFVRLAFAVAINVDPEILIIDEALAVGDAKFQSKCFRKFQEFKAQKKTILFVSHATEQVVRHCDRALLFENGQLFDQGEPRVVANRYLDLLFGTNLSSTSAIVAPIESEIAKNTQSPRDLSRIDSELEKKVVAELINSNEEQFSLRPGYNKGEYRWGNKTAEIVDYCLCASDKVQVNNFSASDSIKIFIKVKFLNDVQRPIYGLTIKTPDGVTVYGTNSRDWSAKSIFVPKARGEIAIVSFALTPKLISGHYLLSLGVAEDKLGEVVPLDRRYDAIEIHVANQNKSFGLADLDMTFSEVA